jgi:hypothetical protein
LEPFVELIALIIIDPSFRGDILICVVLLNRDLSRKMGGKGCGLSISQLPTGGKGCGLSISQLPTGGKGCGLSLIQAPGLGTQVISLDPGIGSHSHCAAAGSKGNIHTDTKIIPNIPITETTKINEYFINFAYLNKYLSLFSLVVEYLDINCGPFSLVI